MIHGLNSERFKSLVQAALGKDSQRKALRQATSTIGERRQLAVDSLPEWEALRARAAEIKAEALGNLDHYLEEFVQKATDLGVHIHWARDGAEACEVVRELAREVGARTIVKSKSMTTEEIGLNHALEEWDFIPVETDLGEWIIQLAGETPSHIIVPAIHMTREEIADLFADQLGLPRTSDPAELTAIARERLRAEFARADMGISGVNFAIAETGSFLVLENEGNARMSTSLPRTHLAVMGIEKIIPRMADLEVFLRLLPRSGTGQHLTSYQSIFSGPKPEGGEGPEELHLLLLDNGRTAILGDSTAREALACIRCGACLNTCPVYQNIGGHAYGSVYPGPIGSIITPQLAGVEKAPELPFACTLCGGCRDVCPVAIDLPELLLHQRAKVKSHPIASANKKGERLSFRSWSFLMSSPRRYRLAAFAARLCVPIALSPGVFGRLARRLIPPLKAWTHDRDLRPPAKQSFRDLWQASEAHEPNSGERA